MGGHHPEPRRAFAPTAFDGLNAVLAEWEPLRAATADTILRLYLCSASLKDS
jgi:hypothetical protein